VDGREVGRDDGDQDRVNRSVYHSPDIARWYRSTRLTAAETAALLKYQAAFAGHDVLDLGVGTGRTTRYLAPLARRYVGIDYAPAMVRHFRAAMPDIEVRQADMRDLLEFPEGSFDFVLGSDNVIDALSHPDRLEALSEARRVLKPNGIFMFSSHNRAVPASLAGPRLVRSRNPFTQALNVAVWLRRWINHAQIRRLRRSEDEYALLNDMGHDYALLHYYIDRDTQRKQLARIGLRLLDVFGASGALVRDAEVDRQSASLLYVSSRSKR
jgi:SAM-dependent methyltransferase